MSGGRRLLESFRQTHLFLPCSAVAARAHGRAGMVRCLLHVGGFFFRANDVERTFKSHTGGFKTTPADLSCDVRLEEEIELYSSSRFHPSSLSLNLNSREKGRERERERERERKSAGVGGILFVTAAFGVILLRSAWLATRLYIVRSIAGDVFRGWGRERE
jgi:hypothetical protein